MEQLLIVLCNPHTGLDDAFNEWYSHVHIRDVMRLTPDAIAVQRFRLAPQQLPGPPPAHGYLTLYEGDTHIGFVIGHKDVFTPVMPISTSFRFEDMREALYDPLAARCRHTDRGGEGDIIVERIPRDAGGEEFAEWYATDRLGEIMRLPAVTEGVFSRMAANQMLNLQPDSYYIALYRTTNLDATLADWPVFRGPAEAVVGCYTKLLPRLTAAVSRAPSLAQAQREASARAGLGNLVYSGFPESIS